MDRRAPRDTSTKHPVYIRQHTGTSENIFDDDALFCYFLSRLNPTKEKYDFRVLAYGLGPQEIHLIVLPRKNNVETIAKSLFTSIAKKRRNAQKSTGKGSIFLNPYFSKILRNQKSVDQAKKTIKSDLGDVLRNKLRTWPYLCTEVHHDKFKICGEYALTASKPRGTGAPYFFYRNGYPTVHWYLRVLDSIKITDMPPS